MSLKAQSLLDAARAANVWIATAESCTAGLIAGEITSVSGSSAIFDRGFVTYTNAAKVEMLDVSQSSIDTFGAVSEQVAKEMAEGALKHSNATVAISVTGIAGPGGSENKPEGRVCFGLAVKNTETKTETKTETQDFGAIGRDGVRRATVDHAMSLLTNAASRAAR